MFCLRTKKNIFFNYTLYVKGDLYSQICQYNTDDRLCQFWKATAKTSDMQYVL